MNLETVGRYHVVERIGRGAMGEVYKAFDPVLNRHVAIKMLTAQHGLDAEMRRRFEREAQSAAQLNHPNIITVYELGLEQGTIFIAMELLAGIDLKEMIGTPELRSLSEKLRIIDQVLSGVAYAHDHGVVHRDLKPANIRVLPSGQVKVVDFGLARMATGAEVTQAGMVLGTPNYMAPEQVQGERADSASDVFSLGAVFYEVLTGRRAFQGDTLHAILSRVITDDPEPIHAYAPEVPVELEAAILRALAKDRLERYANAGAMRAALQAVVPSPGRRSGTSPSSLSGSAAASSRAGGTLRRPSTLLVRDTDLDQSATVARLEDTSRPPPTLHDDRRRSWIALAAGLGVGAVLLSGAAIVAVRVYSGRSTTPAVSGREPVERTLREQFVESLIQLGRLSLENKEYEEASRKATQALKEDPRSAAARDILEQAEKAIRERDAAAADARAALARQDMAAASEALSRLLRLDPRHPAVPELLAALNERFRGEADGARRASLQARADAGPAQGAPDFVRGEGLATEGDRLLGRQEFAAAAQKFAEARDAFGRARRAADAEAAARKVAEAEAQRAVKLPERLPTSEPHVPPVTAAPPSPPPANVQTAAPATAAPAAPSGAEPAIRRVLADYGRAIEAKDIGLFRSVKPNLSEAEQKRLEQAFKAVKSQQVGITVDAIQIEGARASVRVIRKDVVNGQAMPAVAQIFRLVQTGEGWRIDSIGQ